MHRTLAALVLALVVVLAGCRTVRWSRAGAGEQDFYRQLQQCEQESQPKWSFCWGATCDQQAAALRRRIDLCMRSNGWNGRTTRGLSSTPFAYDGS
jgi:predicted small secreted protein